MKPGPASTPTAILEARGSPKAKWNRNEPIPDKLLFSFIPEFLEKEEIKTWKDIAPKLINLRVMTNLDWRLLERYCVIYHKWQISVRTFDTKHTEIDTYSSQLLRIETQLGMTPSSRSNLRIDKPQEKTNNNGKDPNRFFKAG